MRYSDSTLLRMTKTELIEQLRCAEHNQKAAEETLAQQAENVKDWEPVVRCRECVHFDPEGYGGASCAESGAMIWPNEDDYCSRGQRKNQSADVRNMDGDNQDGR